MPAVIVNYHKAARAAICLASLRDQTMAAELNIAVVDNSETSWEADTLRGAVQAGEELVIAAENLGYARGVNLGVRAAGGGGNVLLLSPDIILEDTTTIATMARLMREDPSIGVLTTLQRNDDGSRTEIARRFPRPIAQLLRRIVPARHSQLSLLEGLNENVMIEVDWVQSSFVMIRRALWDAIGGLDERYYVFMSDIDLCHRAHRHGLRVVVTSAMTVRADGQRASSGAIWTFFRNKALRIHVRDAIIYYLMNGLRPRR